MLRTVEFFASDCGAIVDSFPAAAIAARQISSTIRDIYGLAGRFACVSGGAVLGDSAARGREEGAEGEGREEGEGRKGREEGEDGELYHAAKRFKSQWEVDDTNTRDGDFVTSIVETGREKTTAKRRYEDQD